MDGQLDPVSLKYGSMVGQLSAIAYSATQHVLSELMPCNIPSDDKTHWNKQEIKPTPASNATIGAGRGLLHGPARLWAPELYH